MIENLKKLIQVRVPAIKVQWGQLRYQSIENIQANKMLSFLIESFILYGCGLPSKRKKAQNRH